MPHDAQRSGAHPALDAAQPFIDRVLRMLPGEHAQRPYLLARFHIERYGAALFTQHGIDLPAHIRNSVEKRQAEFLAGRLCAQVILAAHGIERHGVAIGSHREPLWPPGFVGSITHNSDFAAAIACPDEALLGVGIDIESVIEPDARAAMMDLVVSAAEADLLRAAAGELSFDCLLTLVFSAKESFYKAAFAQVRAYVDFDAVEVVALDTAARVIVLRCRAALSGQLPAGHLCDAHFDFLELGAIFTVVVLKRDAPARPQAPPPSAAPQVAPLLDRTPT